jgi:hypothetical protein
LIQQLCGGIGHLLRAAVRDKLRTGHAGGQAKAMPTMDDATIVGAAAQQRSIVTADPRLSRATSGALSGGLIVRPAGQRVPPGRAEIRENRRTSPSVARHTSCSDARRAVSSDLMGRAPGSRRSAQTI